ncbi:AF4/FMR2 family member 2 [Bagarius yarrelli]|uniref:AF4/FMR2 family member 2 n=1 Tax=Bagarius yarrelli TaxID=175774 RepID=A0A556TUL9_BAGYA|nr:AF4/FMR2 family member 2 [Bagarius yarrelli]
MAAQDEVMGVTEVMFCENKSSIPPPSIREELDVLRRKEWARRNQETQQEKELYHENTPLFREPYKTNKGDELSIRIRRMLGSYEDGNNFQYSQYEGATRDRSPSSSYRHSGNPVQKDRSDPTIQGSSLYEGTKQGHSNGHSLSESSKRFPTPDNSMPGQSKEGTIKPHKTKTDSNMTDYATLPPVLPDLSPPAEPLSPLHSSDSSESEQDMEEENKNAKEHSLSPQSKSSSRRTVLSHHSETTQKETSHLGGDAPMPASQTFPLLLISKPNLANSKKPMALVRPMDGPDQVNSESPDLKASPDNYHGQSYENLSDLKTSVGKPNLPPLKISSQSVEQMLSNEVQRVEEILRSTMSHNLKLRRHPFTSVAQRLSVQALCRQTVASVALPVNTIDSEHVCEDGSNVALAVGDESGSSSDSESSSESESDSESSNSGTDETPPVPSSNTPIAKPSLKPQNHVDIASKSNPKPTNSTKSQTQVDEDPKQHKNKKHYSTSHTPLAQPGVSDADTEAKPAPMTHKTAPNPRTETGPRKSVSNHQLSKSTKASQSSLLVESIEVTPHNKDATFTKRPKVKTKTSQEKKSESKNSEKRDKNEPSAKTSITVLEDKKETEPVRLSSPPAINSVTGTSTPSKSSKRSRARSPKSDRKSKSTAFKSSADAPLALVVKIQLSQLSRVPQVPKAAKTGSQVENPFKKPSQEKEVGKAIKKRPNTTDVTLRAKKSSRLETDRKSAEKIHVPVPPKRRCEEMEESSRSKSKQKKKSSVREERGKSDKKALKSTETALHPSSSSSCGTLTAHRPLLKFDDKPHPVDYHMKEAKKLKHKADAMVDKMGKALSYLDAAMSFVESGISMETDPQTPKSAYTMFSDTVDLIRFILKIKNYLDSSAPASERVFLVLCMQCQALLQMAMFRCKRESALKYSRTLNDYFKSSKSMQAPSPCISKSSSPMSPMPSPAGLLVSNPASGGGTVSIPHFIQQMASSYINITTLLLSAHETWEQAEELARTHTGLLGDLDKALGHLSLTSSMTALVRYTRQGLHWLRLDTSNPR